MNHETVPVRSGSQIQSLPFSELPHQAKLFLDYLKDPVSLRKYYPNAVAAPGNVREFAGEVLAHYETDRDELCDTLAEINKGLGARKPTLDNIERLRSSDTVAVVTGQQAGLFTGPLYTIYKALSAIRMAELLSAEGTPAVPVFWVASEDHDLEEVARTFFIGSEGRLIEAAYKPENFVEDAPVGNVSVDASVEKVLDSVLSSVGGPPTLREELSKAWSPGASYAAAFAHSISALLGKHGLVVIDPMNDRLKQLASPVYVDAINNAPAIVEAIRSRSTELANSGYHAQVLVDEDYFPLFWHTDDGRRVALRKTGDGIYRNKGERREFSLGELAEIAAREPRRFSPGVMLRPVVQDYLLPTLVYFGGSAEISYFAQNSEAYGVLSRPVTPIMHRESFTVVEPKQRRILDRLRMRFSEMFAGSDAVLKAAAEDVVSPETAKLFADVEEKVNTELNRLDQDLSDLDPTLAANLATRRRKIIYHISALKKKAFAAKLRKEETVERQVHALFNALLPNGALQERSINIYSYIARYGAAFVDRLYDAVDLEDRSHRVIDI